MKDYTDIQLARTYKLLEIFQLIKSQTLSTFSQVALMAVTSATYMTRYLALGSLCKERLQDILKSPCNKGIPLSQPCSWDKKMENLSPLTGVIKPVAVYIQL